MPYKSANTCFKKQVKSGPPIWKLNKYKNK